MTKFLTTFALLTVIATPAFAQSFDPDNGTGNVRAFTYTQTAPQNTKTAAHKSGHSAFAMEPRSTAGSNQNDPTLTGGGSVGYNENLMNY